MTSTASIRLCCEISGPEGRQSLVLNGAGPHWIGRDTSCGISLPATNVSRRHASVEVVSGGLRVTDCSSNGTTLNGSLLQKSSQIVTAGEIQITAGVFTLRISAQWPALAPKAAVQPAASSAGASAGAERHILHQAPAADHSLHSATAEQPGSSVELPSADTRRQIHRKLLDYLDLPARHAQHMDAERLRPEVIAALRRIVAETSSALQPGAREALVQELTDEALGLGPLERFLADPDVNEIMVVDPQTIFVEKLGKMQLTESHFTDDDSVRAAIERIVTPLGRRIDESTPLVDARLKDGSRVNAVIPPLALRGPCITIRKFAKKPLLMQDLVQRGSLTARMAQFLERSVQIRKNIVISGGTGSGKTTLLNVLSAAIPESERVVTVEDAAELQLAQPHVVSLEARPPNLEGKGEYSIRDLVKNALRMRPDRIVVGECRGGEAIDMLQAMNTGHEGSLTTTHANSPKEAIARIETLCLMAGLDLPVRAIRQQIAASLHLIVQQTRFSDGARRITRIAEVIGLSDDGDVELRDIFEFRRLSGDAQGQANSDFCATGYLPSFLNEFIAKGLVTNGDFL